MTIYYEVFNPVERRLVSKLKDLVCPSTIFLLESNTVLKDDKNGNFFNVSNHIYLFRLQHMYV